MLNSLNINRSFKGLELIQAKKLKIILQKQTINKKYRKYLKQKNTNYENEI